jgi:hypothetical protein
MKFAVPTRVKPIIIIKDKYISGLIFRKLAQEIVSKAYKFVSIFSSMIFIFVI